MRVPDRTVDNGRELDLIKILVNYGVKKIKFHTIDVTIALEVRE